jgi:heptosyltransferase-2
VPTADEEEAARAWTARLPTGFLAVHPGSGSPSKNWPAACFAALVEGARMGGDWLLVQGPADQASARQLRPLAGAVLASDLPPRTLGAILARAGAYVGNDSGVSHLAAAWGAPTVALFGPTDPALWAPLGPQVHVMKAPGTSLGTLSIDDVLALVRRLRGAS